MLLLSLSLFLLNAVHAADISFLGNERGIAMVLLTGAIVPGDAQKVAQEFQKAKPSTSQMLMLDSPGGSVHEAMLIGNFIESKKIGVIIPNIMSCQSSCVLILAGGDSKTVAGKVGIHRPFITDLDLPPGAAQAALVRIQGDIRNYLQAKGVLPSLVDDMFSVEPHKMRTLTGNEISRYRLDQRNYLKQEQKDIEMARSLGLTRMEYVEKQARMNTECSKYINFDQKLSCINKIMGTNFK